LSTRAMTAASQDLGSLISPGIATHCPPVSLARVAHYSWSFSALRAIIPTTVAPCIK
jgi:hypothetical protein